ncbi:MAG: putative ABC transporter permease, partial [Lachnospiraceae bacterium]|nr:putative ABC transporter permease [Lachnospiraceae bacterium]
MWNAELFGVSFYYLVSLMIIFSFLGWVWESLYVSVNEKRLVNRGYVTGPVCTIYGVAVVIGYIVLRPFQNSLPALFICGVIIATVLEYVTSIVMEAIFHTSWWDYTDKKFNFHGRICLEASLLWGILAIFLFSFIVPAVDWFLSLYPKRIGEA